MKRVVVVGGGIGGIAAAALLGRAGHRVTLLEANPWLGGKSRRLELDGQQMDTGPSLVTFPGVWKELLRRYQALGRGEDVTMVGGLRLRRLPELGRYHYRDRSTSLPVKEGHPWRGAWERFVRIHGELGPEITRLLTADPLDPRTLPALGRLLKTYGTKLTTRSYLGSLTWLPKGLREIIAIHALNAGLGPSQTPALYASMPAIMAVDGVFVPEGGVYELVLALGRLAHHAGVDVRTGEAARRIEPGKVVTAEGEHRADAVVSGLDADRLEGLLEPGKKPTPNKLSCSGVAVYATLREELDLPPHSVVLPSHPAALYASLEAREEPQETMAFVNYHRQGDVYSNTCGTLAILFTVPANGQPYRLDDTFVKREIERVSRAIGLPKPATEYFSNHLIMHPRYFEAWGSAGGALYGAARHFWRSGPFHHPQYSDRRRPWLYRVGASVHPGGGIPAVLGGALISTRRLLQALSNR